VWREAWENRLIEKAYNNIFKNLHLFKCIQNKCIRVGFEVFTAVTMKIAVFCDVVPCRSCELNRHFGGTFRFHLQGWKIRERGTSLSRWQQSALWIVGSNPTQGVDISSLYFRVYVILCRQNPCNRSIPRSRSCTSHLNRLYDSSPQK
jgi:hypothetical protein